MPTSGRRRFRVQSRPALVLAVVGAGVAGLLYPTVFDPLFALQPMDAEFAHQLWRASQVVLAGGVLVGLLALVTRASAVASLYFALLLLIGGELGFRLFLRHLAPDGFEATHLARVPEAPQTDGRAEHADHPFVHYTGMPYSASGPYNAYGFRGPTWSLDKAPGTLRVALLGGSTTEWGLGDTLQQALDGAMAGDAPPVEVLNFGLAGWTSTHSASNFLLTVQDFQPDAVVVHHGWNDHGMSGGACPRGDYSSMLNTHPQMHAPIQGRALLRASALLRLATVQAATTTGADCCGRPAWSPFTRLNEDGPPAGQRCGDDIYALRGALWPYERNLQAIVTLARARGAEPFVLTMPRTQDRSKDRVTDEGIAHIDAANVVNRRVATQLQARLVDLDAAISPRNELFGDLAHMTPEGNRVKDQLLAQALAGWLADSGAPTP